MEDDPEMNSIYLENFTEPEFEPAFAENGKTALKLLRNARDKFEVMVCDNCTYEMEGITILKFIRQEFPELIMIIITGYGDWGPDTDGYNSGVNKFVKKPIKMSALKELVRVCSDKWRSYQE